MHWRQWVLCWQRSSVMDADPDQHLVSPPFRQARCARRRKSSHPGMPQRSIS